MITGDYQLECALLPQDQSAITLQNPQRLSLHWIFALSPILVLVDGAGKTPAALIVAFCWLIQTSKLPDKSKVLPSQTKSLPPHYCTVIPWDANHEWKSNSRIFTGRWKRFLKLTPCSFTSGQALNNSEQDFAWNERRKRCKTLVVLSDGCSHREMKDMKLWGKREKL